MNNSERHFGRLIRAMALAEPRLRTPSDAFWATAIKPRRWWMPRFIHKRLLDLLIDRIDLPGGKPMRFTEVLGLHPGASPERGR